MERILILGGNGYIAQRCAEVWGDRVILSKKKIYEVDNVLGEIDTYRPDRVFNTAGVKGKPNVDWCERVENRLYTAFGNAALPVIVAEACARRNLHLLHIGSGCVFYGPSPDLRGWKESDFANPESFYSQTKYAGDIVGGLPNVAVARIRIPMDDRPYEGNILDKLLNYSHIIDVKNSLTVVPDMIGVFYKLMELKAEGIFHVTNPEAIGYRTIVDYFRKFIDPKITKTWISEEELVTSGRATEIRSTNVMQSTRLEQFGIYMRSIEEAFEQVIEKWAKAKIDQLNLPKSASATP